MLKIFELKVCKITVGVKIEMLNITGFTLKLYSPMVFEFLSFV